MVQRRIVAGLLVSAAVLAGSEARSDGPANAVVPVIQLMAGQTIDVGDVVALWDSNNVRIDITMTPGWCLEGSHLALATSPGGFPQTKKGNPIPGKFAFKHDNEPCATSDSYLLPTASSVVGWPGTQVLVAIHADVRNTSAKQDESAWGDGAAFDGKNWATYSTAAKPDPVVLNFDDVTLPGGTPLAEGDETPLPTGYGDFAWEQVGAFNPGNGKYGGYAVKSESNLAFIAEAGNFEVVGYPLPAGSPLAATGTGDFDFVGAWFSSVYRDDLPIKVQAWDEGVLVGSTTIVVDMFGPYWFQFDGVNRFTSIDRITFSADDGDPGTWDYFGLDDFTYVPAVQ